MPFRSAIVMLARPSCSSTLLTEPTSTPKILTGDLSVIPSIELKVAWKLFCGRKWMSPSMRIEIIRIESPASTKKPTLLSEERPSGAMGSPLAMRFELHLDRPLGRPGHELAHHGILGVPDRFGRVHLNNLTLI